MSNIAPGCLCMVVGMKTWPKENGMIVTALKPTNKFTTYKCWYIDKYLTWGWWKGSPDVPKQLCPEYNLLRIDDGQLSQEELHQYCHDLDKLANKPRKKTYEL